MSVRLAAVRQLLCRQATLRSCVLLLLQDKGVGGVHQAQLACCSTSAAHTAGTGRADAVNPTAVIIWCLIFAFPFGTRHNSCKNTSRVRQENESKTQCVLLSPWQACTVTYLRRFSIASDCSAPLGRLLGPCWPSALCSSGCPVSMLPNKQMPCTRHPTATHHNMFRKHTCLAARAANMFCRQGCHHLIVCYRLTAAST